MGLQVWLEQKPTYTWAQGPSLKTTGLEIDSPIDSLYALAKIQFSLTVLTFFLWLAYDSEAHDGH